MIEKMNVLNIQATVVCDENLIILCCNQLNFL